MWQISTSVALIRLCHFWHNQGQIPDVFGQAQSVQMFLDGEKISMQTMFS
jgi:hypothetical protein